MFARYITSFVLLLSCQFGIAAQDPNTESDPLVKLTGEIVDRAFADGIKGIEEYIFVPDDEKDKPPSERLIDIHRFADGFHHITRTREKSPSAAWAQVLKSDFKIARSKDDKGNLKDEVVVRFDVPLRIELRSKIDDKSYGRIEWTIKFVTVGGKRKIGLVTQEFYDARSGLTAGAFSLQWWNDSK